jgi:hypothetical protein
VALALDEEALLYHLGALAFFKDFHGGHAGRW